VSVRLFHLFSNLNRASRAYSTWLTRGQHATRPAYISVRVLLGRTYLFCHVTHFLNQSISIYFKLNRTAGRTRGNEWRNNKVGSACVDWQWSSSRWSTTLDSKPQLSTVRPSHTPIQDKTSRRSSAPLAGRSDPLHSNSLVMLPPDWIILIDRAHRLRWFLQDSDVAYLRLPSCHWSVAAVVRSANHQRVQISP